MQAPRAHIFWNAPFGRRHLAAWLRAYGYTVSIPDASHLDVSHEDIVFIGKNIEVPDRLPPGVPCIGVGAPFRDSPFFLRSPLAPRALSHLLQNLQEPHKISEYLPGIPADLMDVVPWLATLDTDRTELLLPEMFQYLDAPRTDTALLPILTDKIQQLLQKKTDLILLGLEQGGPRSRILCARMVPIAPPDEALPLLLHLLEQDTSPEEGEMLIRALSTFPAPSARARLHGEALGRDTLRSLAAIETLASWAQEEDTVFLSQILGHPEALRAISAAHALAAMDTEKAYAALAVHLHADDALVRKVIATLLVKGKEKALAPLVRAMRTAAIEERILGCLVLGYMGLPGALGCLCEQLRHPEATVRFSACEALGRIPSDDIFFPLSAALEDPNQDVVCAAITGLNQQHPEKGARAVRHSMAAHPHRRATLVAAIAAMQATALFLELAQDRKLARDIVQTAAQSRNRRLLHRFLEASARISDPGTRHGCQGLLRKALEDIPSDRPRILVVDDSPTMRRFYETLLPQYGYAVDTARDGLDALNRLRPDPGIFSLVLTDLNMPNKNGIELTRNIREDMGLDLPVLMVSTEKTGTQEKAARKAGISAFLRKPFATEALRGILKTLLRSPLKPNPPHPAATSPRDP